MYEQNPNRGLSPLIYFLFVKMKHLLARISHKQGIEIKKEKEADDIII